MPCWSWQHESRARGAAGISLRWAFADTSKLACINPFRWSRKATVARTVQDIRKYNPSFKRPLYIKGFVGEALSHEFVFLATSFDSFNKQLADMASQSRRWYTKQVILIRHGRSVFNEILGDHRFREAGDINQERGLGKVRSTMRKATHVIRHAHRLLIDKFDHSLSGGGLEQVRELRSNVAALVKNGAGRSAGNRAFLECNHWVVSPLLRALQTGAYALAPLLAAGKALNIVLEPLAQEIMNSPRSYDCMGEEGNVGVNVLTRALKKTLLLIEDVCQGDAGSSALFPQRVLEISDVSSAFVRMDYGKLMGPWWRDIRKWRPEHRYMDGERIAALVQRLLCHPDRVVGVVAHSLLFKHILNSYFPSDAKLQKHVYDGLRNGVGPEQTRTDPLNDKLDNCATLVLTFKYRMPKWSYDEQVVADAPYIIDAQFLFGTGMERSSQVPESYEEAKQLERSLVLAGGMSDVLNLDEYFTMQYGSVTPMG